MANWASLLNATRPGDGKRPIEETQRTAFQRDFDRVVFSSSFRRLQDKTQVYPLAESDYVRTRLTHSIEVSCVARSLGTIIGDRIKKRKEKDLADRDELAAEMGQIAAAAALAHDIGNPPFGHIGESAISEWFETNEQNVLVKDLSPREKADFARFEGNAQGFRILTRLGNNRISLKLTAATLGAFVKYPTSSLNGHTKSDYIGRKKSGFFQEDLVSFQKVAEALSLRELGDQTWQRHPLVFLVEAADDICYRIVDVEDGVKVGRIEYKAAEECLRSFLPKEISYIPDAGDRDANLGWLRATAIGTLIFQAVEVFLGHEKEILDGKFSQELLDLCPSKDAIDCAKDLVVSRIFNWERTLRAEVSGSKMIKALLDDFVQAATQPTTASAKKLLGIVPNYVSAKTSYEKLLCITDFVSGMTDSYLVQTHSQLGGVFRH